MSSFQVEPIQISRYFQVQSKILLKYQEVKTATYLKQFNFLLHKLLDSLKPCFYSAHYENIDNAGG